MSRFEKTHVDWLTIALFAACVFIGWFNIYAAVFDPENQKAIFDFSVNSGKQLMWIGSSLVLIILIMTIDFKVFEYFAYVIYGLMVFSLILVRLLARDINGQYAWLEMGSFRFQPSEFAKFATALALAKYLGRSGVRFADLQTQLVSGLIIGLPVMLILVQNDTGSALVFFSLVLVLYREGLSPWFLILGFFGALIFILALAVEKIYLFAGLAIGAMGVILMLPKKNLQKITLVLGIVLLVAGMIWSVDFAFYKVLQPHQRNRILVLLNPEVDKRAVGYNLSQSMIAIGSGGLAGKGFLEGTQTKFNFVPEQSTDFIFCTIGEEHGWLGGTLVIVLFMGILLRLVHLAERQKDKFARIYGYAVASILFFHFLVNIGMTIGLMPVIGIPLPFFSYGGSSLWSFTILLFIFLKLDAHRMQLLTRS
jgi:rod shape determining protein RodA